MIRTVLLSPPVAGLLFFALAYGLYRLSGRLSARGQEEAGKRQAYACGEDLLPPEGQMTYQAFFQLALMFGLLHLATVAISTLPSDGGTAPTLLVYLGGIVVSVLVLTAGRKS